MRSPLTTYIVLWMGRMHLPRQKRWWDSSIDTSWTKGRRIVQVIIDSLIHLIWSLSTDTKEFRINFDHILFSLIQIHKQSNHRQPSFSLPLPSPLSLCPPFLSRSLSFFPPSLLYFNPNCSLAFLYVESNEYSGCLLIGSWCISQGPWTVPTLWSATTVNQLHWWKSVNNIKLFLLVVTLTRK